MKFFLVGCLCLGIVTQSFAAGYDGQSCSGGSGAAIPAVCTGTMSVTSGNIIVCVGTSGNSVLPTMSNTGTATITWGSSILMTKIDATNTQEIAGSTGTVTGTGTMIPTMTFTGTPGAVGIVCAEFNVASGATDGTNSNVTGVAGTGTNAILSGTITTGTNGDYLVGGVEDTSGSAATLTAGTVSVSFTKILCDTSNGGQLCLEWGTQTTAASSTQADWTTSSTTDRYVSNIIAIKASGAVASVVCPNMSMLGVGCQL